ncbi:MULTISPECIES: DUF6783 domain-containing protein [unclassified Ruminococcus]
MKYTAKRGVQITGMLFSNRL